jgi:hypothetical protein
MLIWKEVWRHLPQHQALLPQPTFNFIPPSTLLFHAKQKIQMTFLICPRWGKIHPPSPSSVARSDHDGPLAAEEPPAQNLGTYVRRSPVMKTAFIGPIPNSVYFKNQCPPSHPMIPLNNLKSNSRVFLIVCDAASPENPRQTPRIAIPRSLDFPSI